MVGKAVNVAYSAALSTNLDLKSKHVPQNVIRCRFPFRSFPLVLTHIQRPVLHVWPLGRTHMCRRPPVPVTQHRGDGGMTSGWGSSSADIPSSPESHIDLRITVQGSWDQAGLVKWDVFWWSCMTTYWALLCSCALHKFLHYCIAAGRSCSHFADEEIEAHLGKVTFHRACNWQSWALDQCWSEFISRAFLQSFVYALRGGGGGGRDTLVF